MTSLSRTYPHCHGHTLTVTDIPPLSRTYPHCHGHTPTVIAIPLLSLTYPGCHGYALTDTCGLWPWTSWGFQAVRTISFCTGGPSGFNITEDEELAIKMSQISHLFKSNRDSIGLDTGTPNRERSFLCGSHSNPWDHDKSKVSLLCGI